MGRFPASCRRMTDRSSALPPPGAPTTTGLILHPPDLAGVSAAKDTEVSAERLGNIVHQAASVMAGCL